MHDLVIRNALLVDGLGGAPRHGSLAVAGGRIAAVGEDVGAGRRSFDAAGLALAPGIIDNHTHYDAQVTWDPDLAASTAVGVTTAVIGNCGFTIAPCRPADRDLTMRNLTNVEGMSLEALRAGIRWEFETVPEYLAMLERNRSGLNLAAFVGHSSVRTFVMRDEAARRAATAAEVEAMRALVAEGMRAGSIGFATSTSPAHNGDGGIPMPSRLADDAELFALTGALRESRGVFMLTKGGHTKVSFLEELAARNGRPAIVAALLHSNTAPDAVFRDLDEIGAANARGRRLVGAISCCPLSMDFTLAAPYPFEGLAAWQPALGQKGEAFKRVIAQPGFRDAICAELARPAVFRLFSGEWDKVFVVEAAHAENRGLENRSLADIARAQGKDPLDALLDLALAEDLDTVFVALLLNSDEDAVARLIRHPHSLVSLSDAGAHLTFFNDAGFGLHLLGHWVRERGALTLAEGVRKLTSEPARVFGIRGRGRLEAGCAADLLLFDPATVGRGPKRRIFDLPAGAARLVTPAVGVHGVWVNGERVVDANGPIPSAPRAGRLLREFGE
ncbi:MAG TPA: amidohydrolase family protein [Burkholderiales bacterium]|nr:amidohydrolase family protein [Burkholderiales bacterium]